MLLTAKEIAAISAGTVRIEKESGGLALHRFTEGQTEVFLRPDPLFPEPYFTEQYKGYFGHNCRTCAGVCLDFYTDSRRFRLKIGENEVPNDAVEGLFDLYINGKLRLFAPASDGFDAVLGAGMKRITLWFPYFNFPLISAAEIDNGASLTPAGAGVDALFLGDSITHGVSAAHASNTCVARFSRLTGLRILNQANSGYVYNAETLERVCSPRLIICAYGCNDRGRKSAERLRGDADAYYARLRELYPGVPVAAILPTWQAGEDAPENRDRFAAGREILRGCYERAGAHIVDGERLFPHSEKYLADKAVHPNDAGFAYYARRLAADLAGAGIISPEKNTESIK